ncbi:MAG: hypothetical protein IPJ65_34175 [Archangiaceae bacterium]|nr:hypothetical protein [Archangiaceae bacterium]
MHRLLLVGFAFTVTATAWAKPPAPSVFCMKYPTAPTCVGGQPPCAFCHSAPPTRNAYGMTIEAALAPGAPRPLSDGDFATALPLALAAAEAADSDGDGVSNLVELQKGTLPADPKSLPAAAGACAGTQNPAYDVCRYDARYTFKKVKLDFCGASPTWDEMLEIDAAADPAAYLDGALDVCLKSEFWRAKNGQLWELAHKKIRPIGSLKAGEDPGIVGLADYYDDYALYAWSQIDNHDAREVLTATYFVTRAVNPTRYAVVQTRAGQNVDAAHRAGNLTTGWNLGYNVMFTALPRNAASQAYRAYLGLDIAKQEGLYAIANEPRDFDAKGVGQDLCKQCHATLDPLSYPWRNYNGLTGTMASQIESYLPNRIETLFANQAPNIGQIPEAGYILGQPVSDLKQWARVAADSDPFAVNSVMDYWKLAMGAPPTAEQNAEFVTLWQGFKGPMNYGVERMLHALVKTEAYGAP